MLKAFVKCYNNAMFEYKIVTIKDGIFTNDFGNNSSKIEELLNSLGREGWELVQSSITDTAGILTERSEIVFIFKRSKQFINPFKANN